MRKIIISVSWYLAVLFVSMPLALAAPSAPFKIGILDVQLLMAKTGAAKQASSKIRKQYTSQSQVLANEQRVLDRELKKYNQNKQKLKPDEIKYWQRKLKAQQQNIQQKHLMLQSKIATAQNLATQKIITNFFTIVAKIAEKQDLDLVLFKDSITYSNLGMGVQDITSDVIKFSANLYYII